MQGGVRNLPWLMQAAVVVMVLVNPLYSGLVARLPRSRFIPIVYRGFLVLTLLFFAGLSTTEGETRIWMGRAFYVYVTVFNLFVLSVMWSLLADLWRSEQSKRLYGVIAAGGSLGALFGSGVTALFAESVGAINLLLPSVVLLEGAVFAARRLMGQFQPAAEKASAAPPDDRAPQLTAAKDLHARPDRPVGGSIWAGIQALSRSPYLLGIAVFILLQTVTSTFAYVIQAEIVESSSAEADVRTSIFAQIDFFTNALTLILQTLVAARLVRWIGVGWALCTLPLVSGVGFLVLGASPTLMTLAVFQVLRRSSNYGISKPAREMLYTVVTPEEKYKAKNFIDLAVYRGGDALGSEIYKWINRAAIGIAGATAIAAPMSLVWIVVALFLGRRFKQGARAPADLPGQAGAGSR